MSKKEYDDAVAAFLAQKGVTRCPTVCAVATQSANISEADREILRRREEERQAALAAKRFGQRPLAA